MAIYTFRDCAHGIELQSSLRALRALFILARHDIESAVLYEPISIQHNGVRYDREDILRLTTYERGKNVRVLLPESEAA